MTDFKIVHAHFWCLKHDNIYMYEIIFLCYNENYTGLKISHKFQITLKVSFAADTMLNINCVKTQ